MTDVQEAFWIGLTDQRVANLWEAADYISDLSAEGKEFLRSAKPETLTFLKELRKDEVEELGNAIENARAFRRGGRLLRWSIVTLFGTFVGMSVIWDKISALWKASK